MRGWGLSLAAVSLCFAAYRMRQDPVSVHLALAALGLFIESFHRYVFRGDKP